MYDTINEGVEYEVVIDVNEGKTGKIQPPLPNINEEKFNLDPCPAYVPVASQGGVEEQGGEYETVSTV